MELKLKQHPASIRTLTGRQQGEYPVDFKIFKGILNDFTKLKIDGELFRSDTDDFKEDLLRNDPEVVIDFIEKSIEIPLLHPFMHILSFEVLKSLLLKSLISSERYGELCRKLLEVRGDDISKRYDLEKLEIILGIHA